MHDLIREIQAIAQTGLHYTKDPYDHERYVRLREISYCLMKELSEADLSKIKQFFIPEQGYATPKVDLRACVVQEGKVLLVKERADGKWTLPGGWADQNESPREGIIREVKEESGYDIEILDIYAIKDRDRHEYSPKYPVSLYKMFFTGSIVGGRARENIEVSEVDFFGLDNLPPLSETKVVAEDVALGLAHFEQRARGVYFD